MRMVDAFCGAGGISDGASCEGWEVIGIDVVKRPEYRHPFIHKDIREVTAEDIGPVDWFHASPPCQRFSTARASRVHDPPTVADLDLLQAALRLRDQLKPRFWSVENVAGAVPLFSSILGPPVLNNGAFRFWGNFPPFLMPTSLPHRKGRAEKSKTGKQTLAWKGKHRSPWLRAYIPATISRPLAAAVASCNLECQAGAHGEQNPECRCIKEWSPDWGSKACQRGQHESIHTQDCALGERPCNLECSRPGCVMDKKDGLRVCRPPCPFQDGA